MQGFREGQYDVLVATDIAARGIDVANISHVINFDLPNTPDAYTHRIGRTGRSECRGKACTFVTHDDFPGIKAIERVLKIEIPRIKLRDFGGPDDDWRREKKSPGRSGRSGSSGFSPRRGRGPRSRPGIPGKSSVDRASTATGSKIDLSESFGSGLGLEGPAASRKKKVGSQQSKRARRRQRMKDQAPGKPQGAAGGRGGRGRSRRQG